MIETQGLSKEFVDGKRGKVAAVQSVSLSATPGRILGLLGRNGAGKSTFLRMLSTVIKPTAGSAKVNGFDIVTQSEQVRASIGFMSTSTALYGRLTPVEVLEYFGSLYGIPQPELKTRVDYVMKRFGIESYADGLCDKLSTGQKQRVNIARTILHDPPVLFFDEPTSGLDVVMSQDVMEFVEEVKTQGKTVVYCTHIMSEVERLCDEVAVIHDGIVCDFGTVSVLKERHEATSLEQAFLKIVGYQRGASLK